MPKVARTESEVLDRARFAVSIPYRHGHSDIGDTLVSMLKGEFSPTEAYDEIECFISDYTDRDKQ